MSFDLASFQDAPEAPSIDIEPKPNNSPNAGNNSAKEQGVEIPSGWKPTADKPIPVMRCTAIAKSTGERCGRWSLRGAQSQKCPKHGGQLPNVKEHAAAVVESSRMRLMNLTDVAVDTIEELMRPGTADQVRLKAATETLARAGIKDGIDLNVEVTHNVSMAEEVTKKLETMRARLTPAEPEDEEIIDAEEV